MFTSWKLGRVEGIEVFLHPTVLLMIAYAMLTGGPDKGLLFAAIFGCVFLHEMGHALAARWYGIRTEHITLYPIGGIASLERMPRSAGPEILIALAGPMVNFVLAGVLWGLLLFIETVLGLHVHPLLVMVLGFNLLLGLFNLLPVFPMDGGRIFRAALSSKLGRVRATVIASTVGQTVAMIGGMFFLWNGMLVQVGLTVFVYVLAGLERSRVVAEENWRNQPAPQKGWPKPPFGMRWAQKPQAAWVEPILIRTVDEPAPRSWR